MELPSFKKSIKREASAYSVLKDEHFFDKFQRDLLITAKSHDVSVILDPSYSPGHSPEERELFEAKQVFMYKVFNETLQTDMGRTTVRKYLRSTDAQAVWKEYSDYMTTSSKGASEKSKLTHYVTNTVLDNQFRGTTQQFVLDINEQFRRLDELTDLSERLPDSIKMALLQNAVKDITQLSIVETLNEYTSITSGDGSFTHLNYLSYYNLLINACVRYDATNTSTPSKRRNVYAASGTQDFPIIEEPHETQFSQDIDTPSDQLKFATFWRSHGRCALLGSLTGRLLDDAQTTLHVEPSPISERTVPDGRSMRNKRTRGKMCANPFWRVREPIWRLECPFSNPSMRTEEPSMASNLHIKSSISNTYQ